MIESRYTTLPIFDREQISWGNKIDNPQAETLNATYQIRRGHGNIEEVKLPATKPGQRLFAELVQYSNGDAYDRTGSVFMIPTDKAVTFLQGLQQGAQAITCLHRAQR